MTLEEANELALDAAGTDDVLAIQQALEARAAAMKELVAGAPSVELARRIAAAIEAGDEIGRALMAIKYRIGLENARLAQLKSGLTAGTGPRRKPSVDCRG